MGTKTAERAAAATARSSNVDPVGLAHLRAGQFQHLTTVGVAGAGGVLILLQAALIPTDQRWWLALALFAATAVVSMYGQIAVVDDATEGRPPGRKPRTVRGIALALLGATAGAPFANAAAVTGGQPPLHGRSVGLTGRHAPANTLSETDSP